MPFRTEKFITRDMLRAEPATLFVFGDNVRRRGTGGQAAEMRGEKNAVGIPTKWAPSMYEGAFFSDRDYAAVHAIVFPIFMRLGMHLAQGGDVVWPQDGIGTGRAELARRAPAIMTLIETMRSALETGRKLSYPGSP
jgi:hypothetical protein